MSRVKQRLSIDELNAADEIKTLYEKLDADNRKEFRRLYIDRYTEVSDWLDDWIEAELLLGDHDGERAAEAKRAEEAADAYLETALDTPDAVTHYAYASEVVRKRERAVEAVNAARGAGNKQEELSKALRLWSRQTQQYAETVSDAANTRALKDAGVKYVVWHTQDDAKVCAECVGRDGKIYRIDRIPDKPHYRCRCWWSASA